MNYSAVLVGSVNFSSQAVRLTQGCKDPNDAACRERDFDHPIIHFTVESWQAADVAARTGPRIYQPLLQSILSYGTTDTLFVWQRTVDAGFKSPQRLSLDYYKNLNAQYSPHIFFDPWTKIFELLPQEAISKCSELGPGSYMDRQAGDYSKFTGDTAVECQYNDMVWFSPTCRLNTTLCIPLVLQYNYQITMQLAFWLQMPVAIVKAKDGTQAYDDAYYTAIHHGNFIFDWYKPDDSLMDNQGRLPTLITMPTADLYEQSQQLYKTGYPLMNPRNFFWNRLPSVDPFVAYLVSNFNLYDQDMNAMMLRSRSMKNQGTDPTMAVPWNIACDWLKANRDRWAAWIPISCSPGSSVDAVLTSCHPCPPGSACVGGFEHPVTCPVNTYCPPNASGPTACPEGRYTSRDGSSEEGDCSHCPDGAWVGGRCTAYSVLLPCTVLPALALLCLTAWCCWRARIVTSRRLLDAESGSAAGQADLPYELRRKYEAVRVIGRGAFGVVVEAWQLNNGRRNVRRAVKLMYSGRATLTPKEIRRMDREVRPRPVPCPPHSDLPASYYIICAPTPLR